jgi:hypothetical protein
VFTEPMRAATGSIPSRWGITSTLKGTVTDTPTKPRLRRPVMAPASEVGRMAT